MHYSGSKANIANGLLYYVLKNRNGLPYVEPFLGGANVMCNVPPEQGTRIGNDYNHYIIALWKALQEGWQPPLFVTKDEYMHVKNNKNNFEPYIVGYMGTVCSYNGYWYNTYQGYVTHTRNNGTTSTQNHQRSARQHMMNQIPSMMGVKLFHGDYKDLIISNRSVIYCDPPYIGAKHGYMQSGFNHTEFFQWARQKIKEGNIVFVSEYVCPDDWISIWEGNNIYERGQIYGTKKREQLFVHESQIDSLDLTKPVSTIPKIKIPVKG